MNFLELQAAVMSDRFDESQRGDVKTWINSAYWQIWAMEEWTFRLAQELVTVTANSATVTGTTADVLAARSLIRGDGTPLHSLPYVDFERTYYDPRNVVTGFPQHYTLLNGTVLVGPISSETASDYQLVYEKEYTKLAADGDTPLIPEGGHMAIVFKASATGLKLQNDFTWQFHEQDYQEQLNSLRSVYLDDLRDRHEQMPAWPW